MIFVLILIGWINSFVFVFVRVCLVHWKFIQTFHEGKLISFMFVFPYLNSMNATILSVAFDKKNSSPNRIVVFGVIKVFTSSH